MPCSGAYPAKATSRSTCKLPPRTVSGLTSRLGEPGRRCAQRVSRVRVSTTNWFDDARPAPRTGPGRQIGLGSCVALGAAAFAGRVFATGRGGRLQTAVAAAATGTGSTVSATTDEASTAPSIADDLTNGCIGDPASAAAASGLAKACGSSSASANGSAAAAVPSSAAADFTDAGVGDAASASLAGDCGSAAIADGSDTVAMPSSAAAGRIGVAEATAALGQLELGAGSAVVKRGVAASTTSDGDTALRSAAVAGFSAGTDVSGATDLIGGCMAAGACIAGEGASNK